MLDDVVGQMGWPWPRRWLAANRSDLVGLIVGRQGRGEAFVEVGEGELELLDLGLQLLERLAEGDAQQARQPGPERLDLEASLLSIAEH